MVRQWLSAEAVGDVTLDLREDAFNAVTERDMSFYDQYPTGKIVSRTLSDTQAFSETVRLSINLMSQLLLVVLLIIYLFTVNVNMTLILIAIIPFIVYTALKFRIIARRTVTNSRRQLATVNAHIQESISGIGVAKAFRREQMIYDEFKTVNEKSYQVEKINGFVFSSIFPILITIAGVGVAAVVWFGINLAQAGVLTAGVWFLFIQGMGRIWFPLTSIASFWSQFQLGLAAGERVFALLDAEALVKQKADVQVSHIDGEIEFVDMDFHYNEGEQVLRRFSLKIHPGETLALVGHTGSGKSSIAKLINRFYEYQSGELLVDGRDIRIFNLPSYRSQLGVVTQTPFLFDGTVLENIRYGKPEATDEGSDRYRLQSRARRLAGQPARGPGDAGGRTRRQPVHGPASIGGDRARAAARSGHLHPRRSHRQRRSPDRNADPGRAGCAAGQPHLHRHRPSPLHHSPRRPHHRARSRRDHRIRHA